jgi:hypothetical protein
MPCAASVQSIDNPSVSIDEACIEIIQPNGAVFKNPILSEKKQRFKKESQTKKVTAKSELNVGGLAPRGNR